MTLHVNARGHVALEGVDCVRVRVRVRVSVRVRIRVRVRARVRICVWSASNTGY